jgi:hypothetical protein
MRQRGNNYHVKFRISLHTNISVENIPSPEKPLNMYIFQANDPE